MNRLQLLLHLPLVLQGPDSLAGPHPDRRQQGPGRDRAGQLSPDTDGHRGGGA